MEIGQIVYSIKGRDSGEYYIVVKIIDKYVYICDGKLRHIERPKKKNIAHVKYSAVISNQLLEKLKNNELNNSDIRKILRDYYNKESISDCKEE